MEEVLNIRQRILNETRLNIIELVKAQVCIDDYNKAKHRSKKKKIIREGNEDFFNLSTKETIRTIIQQ